MKDMRPRVTAVGGWSKFLASGLVAAVLVMLPALTQAAAPAAGNTGKDGARFASVEVEIWPEYDRRGQALVIVSGELAADVALPATVSLRVPASSDPTAVAFATAPGSGLFNLEHERIYGDAHITLRFKTEHRLVHIEFYDRIATDNPARRFTYVWPADAAVERLNVQLQEPAMARDVAVKPDFGTALKGQDGLLYRRAELGAVESGKRVPIEIGYTKTDPRTSSEILGLGKTAAAPPPAAGATATADMAPSGTGLPSWFLIAAVLSALLIGGGSVFLWWRLVGRASGAPAHGAGFCSKCGNRVAADDRFCPKCGNPLSKH